MIQTNRLLLADITLNDAEAVYAMYSNPDVIKYYTEAPVGNEEETLRFINRITAGNNLVLGIRLLENPNTIIGDCALHDWDEQTGTIEIGGSLLPQYWGRGIIPEAFHALLQYARNEWNVRAVFAKTNRHNRQAIRAVKKLGFTVSVIRGEETVLCKKYKG